MEVGKLINSRRTELGLTLEEVGSAVGVSKSTVKKWEDGFIPNMRRDKIAKLASVLQLDPVAFITDEITVTEDPKLSKAVALISSLNDLGQDVAIQRLEELNEIGKYKQDDDNSDGSCTILSVLAAAFLIILFAVLITPR